MSNSILINSKKRLFTQLGLSSKLESFKEDSIYKRRIINSIVEALKSEWWASISQGSRDSYLNGVKIFVKWLTDDEVTKDNYFHVLNRFQLSRITQNKVKPQSTGVSKIIRLFNESLLSINQSSLEAININSIIDNTKVALCEKPKPTTLTSFFSNSTWLRSVLGEKAYLKLESPSRLVTSFSIAAATLLHSIIDSKRKISCLLEDDKISFSPKSYKNIQERTEYQSYCKKIYNVLNKSTTYTNSYLELFYLDTLSSKDSSRLISALLSNNEHKPLSIKTKSFLKPLIFSKEYLFCPSPIEQLLFAWICASLAVQPSNIASLKKSNFQISYNRNKNPILIQCEYYKSRSNIRYTSPIVDIRSIEGKAIFLYLNYCNFEGNALFTHNIQKLHYLTFASHDTISTRLSNIWQSTYFNKEYSKNIEARSASSIFIDAFNAFSKYGTISYHTWYREKKIRNQCTTSKSYRSEVEYPIPAYFFTLQAIKTSSVYSRSDRYRESDLINVNSHTNNVEKLHYLTDENKDWINQHGRITRLVLNDLEKVVYKPSLNKAVYRINDILLRTTLINGKSSQKSFPKNSSVCESTRFFQSNTLSNEDILVIESPESVVYMLHYILEVENKFNILLNNCPTYFEQTVLPKVEWMNVILHEYIKPTVFKLGKSEYNKIKHVLPPLFTNEARGGVA
ncbi:hypothetical protein [Pleionea sediminis]|uniref:hypothetical protein n=1 Tax=Pleionea sediminis TaxID=2569479 RepID=UPI001187005D|nr:hypothetical protein [Pleionea sediminis]